MGGNPAKMTLAWGHFSLSSKTKCSTCSCQLLAELSPVTLLTPIEIRITSASCSQGSRVMLSRRSDMSAPFAPSMCQHTEHFLVTARASANCTGSEYSMLPVPTPAIIESPSANRCRFAPLPLIPVLAPLASGRRTAVLFSHKPWAAASGSDNQKSRALKSLFINSYLAPSLRGIVRT